MRCTHTETSYASLSFFVSEGTWGTFEILGECWPSKFNGNVAIAFEKTQDFTDYVKFIPERTPVKRGGSYQEHGQFPLEAPTSVEARSKSGDKTKPTTYIENGEG